MGSPPERLTLTSGQVERITAHVRDERPNEACGLLGGRDGEVEKVYPLPNAERSPVRYLAEPEAQMEAMTEIEKQGWKIAAIYHSHPDSPAYPSDTDLEMAFYPQSLYLIISLVDRERPALRAFRIEIEEGGIEEREIEIRPDP